MHSPRFSPLLLPPVVLLAGAMAIAEEPESLAEIGARLSRESTLAYETSPFSAMSRDYFHRFSRDRETLPGPNEVVIDDTWTMEWNAAGGPLRGHLLQALGDFLARLGVRVNTNDNATGPVGKRIQLSDSGGGKASMPASFTIRAMPDLVAVHGRDADGLRDGVVKLVEIMGMRQAPFVPEGERVYTPRLGVRLGTTPWMGSLRDLVFMGYNTVFASGGSLYALSTSDAIPELGVRRVPGILESTAGSVATAEEWGLKSYAFIDIRQKFDKEDPVFVAHPDIRGALTWKADGQYVLCTEHPLVKQWLRESMAGLFQAAPRLSGVVLIIGGEGFYHCFMRPYGVEKGHTNCPRCEAQGAETVVAHLVNLLAEAARSVNPEAEVIAWPYSAEHVWSADRAQAGFIEKLRPGAGIFTEIEKDEYVEKPNGVRKHLWDYSIDLIGPGERAKQQIAACRAAGIPIYMKSEPELGFEAPRLPHIPCLDRWLERAEALASCGADGAWVFPAFRPCYGTSAAESYKLMWWDPAPDRSAALDQLAARIAGREAGPHLREAWRAVSEAIAYSPELPPYYTGPYYLGPAHPMIADPEAEVPRVFYGRYLFMAEISDEEGLPLRPTFDTKPRGDVEKFGAMYRRMRDTLARALEAIEKAKPLVPERCRLPFAAEESPIRWFHHTARTQANFYESCTLRDRILEIAALPERDREQWEEARSLLTRWRAVLEDELANTEAALSVVQNDMRLDFYYGGDHTFPHAAEMIQAKIEILRNEIAAFLPSLAAKCGIGSQS